MAKFQLNPGETEIGSGQVALHQKQLISTKAYDGKIYVTDQRVSFWIRMAGGPEMDLPLSEIQGFSVGKKMLATAVTIHARSGESYTFTGFPVKKLQDWLRQAGVQEQ